MQREPLVRDGLQYNPETREELTELCRNFSIVGAATYCGVTGSFLGRCVWPQDRQKNTRAFCPPVLRGVTGYEIDTAFSPWRLDRVAPL